jgi:phosphohistidine phosphatase
MKTLCIVRHAKSSWKEDALTDEMRPLNKRGKVAAPLIGRVLAELGFMPDLILTSSAVRAHVTAELIAGELQYPVAGIEVRESMYMAGLSELLAVIAGCSDEVERLMVVGHNPGLYALAMRLSEFNEDNLPTAAAVCIELPIDHWTDIHETRGRIRFYEYPRKHGA